MQAKKPCKSDPRTSSSREIATFDAVQRFTSQPGYLIRRLHQIAVALFSRRVSHLDLTPVQYAALVTVSGYPNIDQQAAASRIGVDRTTMNEVAKRLATKGWLTRKPGRGRQHHLQLTRSGQKILNSAANALRGHADDLLRPLTRNQRKMLLQTLHTVLQAHIDEF
jgi:DNA-binding MarR family transcriptional regulator